MAIYDYPRIRYNTVAGVLEMNTGFENWIPVPLGIIPGELVLADTQILVGQGTGLAGAVALSGGATIANTGVLTLSNTAVTGQALTGYVSGAGTLSATDTILQGFNKLNGNVALKLNLTGGTIVPASNSTSTFAVDTQSSVKVLSVDTTHSKVLIGAVDPDTDSALMLYKDMGTGNTLYGKVQNINTGGLSEWQSSNDNGGFAKLGVGGSTVANAFANQPYVWGNNNGVMLLSTGSAQQVLFNFNVVASSGTKAKIDSTGAVYSENNYNFTTSGAVKAHIDGGVGGIDVVTNSAGSEFDWTFGADGSLTLPQLTSTERDAIPTPTEGLFIYNVTTHTLNFYNGSAWRQVTDSAA